jgi:hypothetical protein
MTASDSVALLRKTLVRYLRQSFESGEQDADGDLVVRRGSAVAYLRPVQTTDARTVVHVWSITNLDLNVNDVLTRFLATASGDLAFGGFFLDQERPAVVLRHALLGDFVGRDEVAEVIEAVSSSAQVYGARIKAMFGGRLFSEPVESRQDGKPLPNPLKLVGETRTTPRTGEAVPVAELGRRLECLAGNLFKDWRVDGEGDFAIGAGRAVVWIRPVELPRERSGVRIWSITNVDMRVDDELTRFIATENASLAFVSLYLEQGRPEVAAGHTLAGTLNGTELEVAVEAVASAAKEYGSYIKERFGGRLFSEIQ